MSADVHKSNVLVTGSSGLIGSAIINRLHDKHKFIAVDLKSPENRVDGVHYFEADLTKDSSTKSIMEQIRARGLTKLTSCIHLAAYYDFSGKPSPLYKELTVNGTKRMLEALKAFEVEQFVYSSSLLVMKPTEFEGEKLTEESPVQAEWEYPQSKLEAEEVVKTAGPDVPKVILRIAGVYDEQCHSIPIANQISRIFEKKLESMFFPGDKTHGQPFVHLEDLVSCIDNVIERRQELEKKEIFLIAEPDVLSYEELQSKIGWLLHDREWKTIRIPKPIAKAGAWIKNVLSSEEQFIKPWMIDLADDHYPTEIHRAEEKLGWKPKHRLGDELENMLACLTADPPTWYKVNHIEWPQKVEAVYDRDFEKRRTGS